jgi:hypothetical protein
VVGNGVHRYAPDLAGGGLAIGAEVYDNLAAGGPAGPALRPARADRPGVAVIPMSSPYVHLGGRIRLAAVRRTEVDQVSLSLSTNNGRSYTPLWTAPKTGPEGSEAVIDISPVILRRYTYRLKVEIVASSPGGAGLRSIVLENDVQHAPRTLPRLARGKTVVTVDADGDPGVATRTIACRITPDSGFNKNETSRSMGFQFDNLRVDDGSCWWKGGAGVLTVPVETPGDLVALRMSLQFRARDAKDTIRIGASTDQGKTWRQLETVTGPTPGTTRAYRFGDWPPSTRAVLLRFELTGRNTTGIFSLRVDADHRDPLASPAPRPFRVVYRWREGVHSREHSQEVTALPCRYTIETSGEPELVSVGYEMPSHP